MNQSPTREAAQRHRHPDLETVGLAHYLTSLPPIPPVQRHPPICLTYHDAKEGVSSKLFPWNVDYRVPIHNAGVAYLLLRLVGVIVRMTDDSDVAACFQASTLA